MNVPEISGQMADDLRAWVQSWLAEATTAGFIAAPYQVEHAVLDRAFSLYKFGLTPGDAALSIFGTLH
ncbi:hypothetical protein [Paraburkholderia sp.]|uniref:hypothetical protein n=1 Tax=Paraburkholderia sp. TaxID=1926495 RepID=UPI0023A0EF5F|nr:hypothetical protein [Paraburkholderia sp.]MDE1179302.1 hypothetical protein [Paraburkholderia sp.]